MRDLLTAADCSDELFLYAPCTSLRFWHNNFLAIETQNSSSERQLEYSVGALQLKVVLADCDIADSHIELSACHTIFDRDRTSALYQKTVVDALLDLTAR